MWKRLNGWYSLRVVNVNVNIVAAGVLALLPTLVAVHYVEAWLAKETPLGLRLEAYHKVVISAVTFGVDVISDVVFYYCLHFLANHWPKGLKYRSHDPGQTQVPFFRDATIVQFQRMVLSPLLYAIWLSTQQVLMQAFDVSSVWATAIGCITAIATIRTIHTFWMIKAEARKRLAQGARILHDLTPRGRAETQARETAAATAPPKAESGASPGAAPASTAQNGAAPASPPAAPVPPGRHAGRIAG